MGDPLSRPARLCRTLLKAVYALFAAAAALLALFWLTAVVGEIIIFLTVLGLLCLLPLLSAAGAICGIAAAVRERKKRYLAMAAAFLPPGVIAGLTLYWLWYAASHY